MATLKTPKLNLARTILQPIGYLFWVSVVLYGAGTTAFLLARLVVRDVDSPLIAFFNSFAHLMIIPALAGLPLALFRRKTLAALVCALPALQFVASYGGSFIPRQVTQAADPGGATFSVLSFNTHTETQNLEAMLILIRDSGADVVAFQELNVALADRLQSDLIGLYPFQAVYPTHDTIGQGVISRFPIREKAFWQHDDLASAQGHMRVVIEIDGRQVALYNLHIVHPGMAGGFSAAQRAKDVGYILARAAAESGPVLLVGDFNMSDQSDDYNRVRAVYGDAYRAVGWGLGLTFPDWTTEAGREFGRAIQTMTPLLVRLDYAFYNTYLRPLNAYVAGTSAGSDHRPLWVRFTWQ